MSFTKRQEEALDRVQKSSNRWEWPPEWRGCPSALEGLDYSVVDEAVEIVEAIEEDAARLARAGFSVEQAREMGACIEVLQALNERRGDRK